MAMYGLYGFVCLLLATNSALRFVLQLALILFSCFRFNLTFLYDEGSSVTLGRWCTKDDVVTSTNETDRHNIIENTEWTSKRYWQDLVQKTQDKDNQNKIKNKHRKLKR